MKFYNLKENDEQVSFAGAVKQGLGKNQGLFFPATMPKFDNIDALLAMPLVERSVQILLPFVEEDLTEKELTEIVTDAFNFPAQLQPITNDRAILELFHGPTLAFKDFGARFMAKCLQLLMPFMVLIISVSLSCTPKAKFLYYKRKCSLP